jgi:hypothetical protein
MPAITRRTRSASSKNKRQANHLHTISIMNESGAAVDRKSDKPEAQIYLTPDVF